MNCKAWEHERTERPMCYLREEEIIGHFVAICPILSEFRRLHFGQSKLSEDKFFSYLNGKNWNVLYCIERILLKKIQC